MNPISHLDAFDSQGRLRVVIECPKGATAKIAYNPDQGVFELKRMLPVGLVFPFDWGFVPGTEAGDGDPVDALVIHDSGGFPGVVAACEAIAILWVEQDGQGRRVGNPRIIAAPSWAEATRQVRPLTPEFKLEIETFFETVGTFAGNAPRAGGWGSGDEALAYVRSHLKRRITRALP
jgi:inorganic pyrophosphatase